MSSLRIELLLTPVEGMLLSLFDWPWKGKFLGIAVIANSSAGAPAGMLDYLVSFRRRAVRLT